MHKILLLAVVVSVLGLSGYLFFSQKSAQKVQGTKVAVLKKGQDMSGAPVAEPSADATSGIGDTSSEQLYTVRWKWYPNSSCSGNPVNQTSYVSNTYSTYGCRGTSSGYYYTVASEPLNANSCISAGFCSLGGLGCCDGSQPVTNSKCSSGKSCVGGTGANTCGKSCSMTSECSSGLICTDIAGKICWNPTICMGQPENRIRVQGTVVNCQGQPLAGVRVAMFADTTTSILNSTITDVFGNYRITKLYKDSDGVRKFALAAGLDAKGNGTNYYSRRLDSPSFLSGYGTIFNCGVVNCNYRQNLASGGPYRENYYVGWGWTQSQYKARVVHGTTPTTGFDFKQVNCQ
jgi:hypothetical protein